MRVFRHGQTPKLQVGLPQLVHCQYQTVKKVR
jgi:hypothetical protein